MNFHVIIPARYDSSRLPGKPLADIQGQSMIVRVCQQATLSHASSVTVATDDIRIFDHVRTSGYKAVMTQSTHQSGSDRIHEAANVLGLKDDEIIVNVQGDEPFIPPKNIEQVASLIANTAHPMSTLCAPIENEQEVSNPNCVKVTFNLMNTALYFSRSMIPYQTEESIEYKNYYRHIGIYAYRKSFLNEFISWPTSRLERMEKLEQLRALENGASIAIQALKEAPPPGVDSPEDLQLARDFCKEG